MSSRTRFKAGDTFDYAGELQATENGSAITDLTGWTGACEIRTYPDVLIAELEFTWVDAAERLCRIRSTESTEEWPVGDAYIDIQLTSPAGAIVSTATNVVTILRDVTRPTP